MNDFIIKLSGELKKKLPGKDIQNKMAPVVKGDMNLNLPFRRAAVLILLYEKDNMPFTLFIKRTMYDGVHSGQISFPGGGFESGDINMAATAIRETEEEVGINRKDVEILGQLTGLHIPVSNTEVFPYVGFSAKKPVFIIDPKEVEYIIEAEIKYLIDPIIVEREKMKIREIEIDVPFFNTSGHQIWGATAMILNEFIEIAKRCF